MNGPTTKLGQFNARNRTLGQEAAGNVGATVRPEYESKTDEELMRLAIAAEALTDEARVLLSGELKRRRLDAPDQLNEFLVEQRYYKHIDDTDVGDLTLVIPHGIGRRAYGRANLETRGTRQEYDTTVFAVVFYFPLVPLGTYRFSRERGSKRFSVIEKRFLDWRQIVSVWLKAGTIVAVPLLIADLLSRF